MRIHSSYRYFVVDVFTQQPLEGNPLAVFPDAHGLDDLTMQKIAKELNLSETTFIAPPTRPDCAAAVRIFTPAIELAFAGHPTIGTSFVLIQQNLVPRQTSNFILEEKVGAVPIRVETQNGHAPVIWLRTPPIQYGTTHDRSLCAAALGLTTADLLDITPQRVSAGNPTLFVAVRDKATVDRASLHTQEWSRLKSNEADAFALFAFAPTPEGAYSRMFAPDYGIPEDPASGSCTGPLASFMMRHRLAPTASGTRLISEQGTKMGRRSLLQVVIHGENGADGIDIGGHVTPIATATLTL